MSLFWWHWIIFGIVLIVLELVVPSFTIFWFGLGAILTGIFVVLFPASSLALQLGIFTASSVLCTVLWFRIFRPKYRQPSILVDENAIIGETGIAATRALTPGEIGRARFSVPVMDHDSWDFVSEEPVNQGDRIRIIGMIIEESEGENGLKKKHRILKVERVN